MASTIVVPPHNIITESAVVDAFTAATVDIAALQAGSTVAVPTVACGATRVMTTADAGKIVLLDTAAGSTATLPAATGSGKTYKFLTTVIATTNSHIVKVANATDFFIGIVSELSDDSPPTVKAWVAANSGTVATNSDTVTMNRSTTGSVSVGEWLEVVDVAAATYHIKGLLSGTGTEATPFSAGV